MTLTEHTIAYIKFLEAENKLMIKLASTRGFYELYNQELYKHGSPELAWYECNAKYYKIFGYYRYDSFESFLLVIKEKLTPAQQKMSPKEVLEREFLITWFKQCGFDTWTSFKAIVRHHYPEVTEVKLLEFWQNTAIDPIVLIRVNHTKQILG
jgi:hypothetical protein